MFVIALLNAFSVKRHFFWEAFIDTYLMDQFSYAHKYFKRGKNCEN